MNSSSLYYLDSDVAKILLEEGMVPDVHSITAALVAGHERWLRPILPYCNAGLLNLALRGVIYPEKGSPFRLRLVSYAVELIRTLAGEGLFCSKSDPELGVILSEPRRLKGKRLSIGYALYGFKNGKKNLVQYLIDNQYRLRFLHLFPHSRFMFLLNLGVTVDRSVALYTSDDLLLKYIDLGLFTVNTVMAAAMIGERDQIVDRLLREGPTRSSVEKELRLLDADPKNYEALLERL